MVKENCLYPVSEMVTNYLDGNLTFESESGSWATGRLFSVGGRTHVNEKYALSGLRAPARIDEPTATELLLGLCRMMCDQLCPTSYCVPPDSVI